MGSFGNGFVLQEQPPASWLEHLSEDLGYRTYRHQSKPIWLLDVWSCTGYEHWNFTDPIKDGSDSSSVEIFDRLSQLLSKAEDGEPLYGMRALNLALSLSSVMEGSVFFFAGDDEFVDVAFSAEAGTLSSLLLTFGSYRVSFRSGVFNVYPREFEEDPEFGPSDEVLKEIEDLPEVVVHGTSFKGPAMFFGSAVELWPLFAGDPTKMMGVGTWDPFHNLEDHFEILGERDCRITKRLLPRAAPTTDWNREINWLRPFRTVFRYGVYLFGAIAIGMLLFVFVYFLMEMLR